MMQSEFLSSTAEIDFASWKALDGRIREFESVWKGSESPAIETFVDAAPADLRKPLLVELIKIDQEFRWSRGESPRLESYLERWPELRDEDDAIGELLAAECLTRGLCERVPSFKELRTRFPKHCELVPLARLRKEIEAERQIPAPPGGAALRPCGRYELRELLEDRGHFSWYRGFDPQRGEEVGLSIWNSAGECDPLGKRLLFREVDRRLSLAADDPEGLREAGEFDGAPYVVTPWNTFAGNPRRQLPDKSSSKKDASMNLLQEGQIIRGTYEVERLLGEGAFAQVYRVRHRFLGRQAMKVFKHAGMTIEETEEMLGEALMLSQIHHPNIINVYDANTTDASCGMCGFFTMEYVAGGTLDRFWRSHGGSFVPIPTAVDITRQICRGLSVAHSADPPIVHRDIKPQNILVGYDAGGIRVRVSDFGLAKKVNPLTLLATAAGTPRFKPPEVFKNARSDSCAADVWAVGSVMYLLLCDRLPFAEKDSEGFHPDQLKAPLVPPSRYNPMLDETLDRIALKCMAYQAADRYQNTMELLEDLNTWSPARRKPDMKDYKSTESWEVSKGALGSFSSESEGEALEMIEQANELAKQATTLNEAADLMEEAFNKCPDLRPKYEHKLKLWRRGICM